MGAVRVLSGVASLASNSHILNPCSFREMTFFMTFSKSFQRAQIKKKIRLSEFLNPAVKYFQKLPILPSKQTAHILVSYRDVTLF